MKIGDEFWIYHRSFGIFYKVKKTEECYKDKIEITNIISKHKWFMRLVTLNRDFEKGNIFKISPAIKILFGLK